LKWIVKGIGGVALTAGVVAGLGFASRSSKAADHRDGPAATADPASDMPTVLLALGADLVLAVGLLDRLQIGLRVPMTVFQSGQDYNYVDSGVPGTVKAPDAFALGDALLDVVGAATVSSRLGETGCTIDVDRELPRRAQARVGRRGVVERAQRLAVDRRDHITVAQAELPEVRPGRDLAEPHAARRHHGGGDRQRAPSPRGHANDWTTVMSGSARKVAWAGSFPGLGRTR
jgi:hypothetical protein